MFNLEETQIYKAVRLENLVIFRFRKLLKKIFFVFLVFFLILFIYSFIFADYSNEANKRILGFFLIFFSAYFFSWLNSVFFDLKIKNPELEVSLEKVLNFPEKYNLAEFLDFESAKVFSKAIDFSKKKKDIPLSLLLLYFIVESKSQEIKFIFNRLSLDIKEIKKKIEDEINKIKKQKKNNFSLEEITKKALIVAKERKRNRVYLRDLLFVLSKENIFFQKYLIVKDLKPEDIDNLGKWFERVEKEIKRTKKFWAYDNLLKKGSLARNWTSGYTVTLNKYSIDITEEVRQNSFKLVDHQKELNLLERYLTETEINNVLIIGEKGVGKRSIIYGFAYNALLGKNISILNYKRVVELDMPRLLAEIEDVEKVELILDQIFQEVAKAGNIILLIDNFHNYVSQPSSKIGIIDISGIISSYLQLPQFQLIAITTYEGLHRYIEKQEFLLSSFRKVEVLPISKEDTLELLENLVFFYEKKYKIFISYPVLREIIDLSDRYLPSLAFPEKAINVLDSVMAYVANEKKEKFVLVEDVAKIITERTEIPVGKIEEKEKEILLHLEDLIHQRIINQEEAVKDIAVALRRGRTGIVIKNGPIGSFLFLGPTGVGKTETAKALAEIYFGSEERMIRLDMSEFQEIKDIKRLIGSETGEGILTVQVRENPFSLVLLDELEKAHPNILNLFLQVLDEGYLTDGLGRKVNFKNTIIIATGNAGYKVILESLKNNISWEKVKQRLLDYIFNNNIFRPEFVNRFDALVVFKPLTKQNLLAIAELIMSRLKKNLQEKGIEFVITEELKEKIVQLSYNPVFGARQMRRVVQDKVENVIASDLLSGKIKRGQKILVDPSSFKVVILNSSENL